MSNSISVGNYHRRSSHTLEAYAKGPEALDWSGQPDPFRHFAGAATIPLPLINEDGEGVSFGQLFQPGSIQPRPFGLESVAELFELSLGISAWKEYMGDSWALRCNPSSGNLHPSEGYLISAAINGFEDGVYHYQPDQHQLQQRASIALNKSSTSTEPRLLIGLSSIFWREAWKYGERAFRYCQLDIGHAVASFSYAAATLGWHMQLLDHYSENEVATLLGLNHPLSFEGAEPERGEILFELTPQRLETARAIPQIWFDLAANASWQGVANRLDAHPYGKWPVIAEIAETTGRKERGQIRTAVPTSEAEVTISDNGSSRSYRDIPARTLIKQRRSAQQFDPQVMLPLPDFFSILSATLARHGTPPWPDNANPAATHLLLFVHRVEGLRQGLYALPRTADGLNLMQKEMSKQFLWQKVDNTPKELPLYLLIHADCRRAARTLSCHQSIASDSAFMVSMLSEYDRAIAEDSSNYRGLFIEAGMIGQSLYLEAEAVGFRGTGIGCYFDPAVHQTLGLESTALQSFYHFTIGSPMVDSRIQTLPAYAHLKGR